MGLTFRMSLLASLILVVGAMAAFVATLRSSNGSSEVAQPSARALTNISTTDTYIESLQLKLRRNPNDAETLSQLGAAYLQKTRETGDPTYYSKAEDVLNQALTLDPENPDTLRGLASVALARHDFQSGLWLAQKALDADPANARSYGVVGDALAELGRYDEAVAAYQNMLDLKPNLAAYARASSIRELYGDIEGAREAMRLAVESAGPQGEGSAWARLQLGNLYFEYGDLTTAEQQYNSSLSSFPGYVHALAGLASVKAARGDTAGAIALYREAVDRYPVLSYVAGLGDLYDQQGNDAAANEQYALVSVIAELLRSNGVNTDLDLALYYADHDIRLDDALRQARAEYARRPSIEAADILAWTLYTSGAYEEALVYSNDALRLGGKEPLSEFRAGMIRYKLGDSTGAASYLSSALDTNPHFSLTYAAIAKETLRSLELARKQQLGNQQNPAERLPALDVFVRRRRLGQRERAIDHYLKLALRYVLQMPRDHWPRALRLQSQLQTQKDAGETPVHRAQRTQIDTTVLRAARVPHLDDPPAIARRLDAPFDRRADRVDDKIDAPAARQPPRFFGEVRRAVVDPVIEAELLKPL